MKRHLLIATWLLAAALPREALAQNCQVSATAVSFGIYDPASVSPTDSTGTITVACTGLVGILVSWNIRLSTGGSGSYSPRRMASGANNLNYNLYRNAARTEVWGDGTAGSFIVSDSAVLVLLGITRNYTVHGRIPSSQDRTPGSYSDTITVTLNF